jgi:head-tail adaptor
MAQAGLRRERLTFQQRATDENGDRLGDWETGFLRWGRALARTRGETALQQRLQGLQPLEVTVLRDSETLEITTAWRLLWNGTPYNIRAVVPSEDRREMAILAEWDQSDG